MLTLILLSLTYTPTIHVDRIERNSCCIEQVIFWEWSESYSRYNARGWVRAQDCVDIPGGVLCRGWRVLGPVIVTETEYDPEVENRRLLPEQFRNPMPWGK